MRPSLPLEGVGADRSSGCDDRSKILQKAVAQLAARFQGHALSSGHARQTRGHRHSRRCERGDGQPRPQRQARCRRRYPPGGPDGPGRARVRAPVTAAQAVGRPGRADHPGAGEPDLPGLRPGDRVGAGPARLHARAVHADARRRPRGRLHDDAARARRLGHRLRQRPARRHHRGHHPLRGPARARAADRPGQRVRRGDRRPVHQQRRRRVDGHRRLAPGLAGPHPDRARARAVAVRAGDPQGHRVLRRGAQPAGPGRRRRRRPDRVLAVLGRGRRRRRVAAGGPRAAPRSSAGRT